MYKHFKSTRVKSSTGNPCFKHIKAVGNHAAPRYRPQTQNWGNKHHSNILRL